MALSRRTFSALAGSAALGFALGGSGGPGAPSAFAARSAQERVREYDDRLGAAVDVVLQAYGDAVPSGE
ncbi:hypothetical protein, partial [Streptomyces sp. NPDC004599]